MTPQLVTSRGTLEAVSHRVGDASVVELSGALDVADPVRAGSGVEEALRVVEASLLSHPRLVVLDVSHVEFSRFVVGLLGLVRRRTARVPVPLALADPPAEGVELLERAAVAALYPSFPTVTLALESLADPRSPGRTTGT